MVLGFLFNGNANAGINEPGTGFLGKCKGALKWEHKKLKKIYLEKDKKINVIIYASCTSDRWGWGIKKGKNLENVINKSKTTGEPPLMNAMSVFFAIKNAIASIGNYTANPKLDAPATPEKILMSIKNLKRKI